MEEGRYAHVSSAECHHGLMEAEFEMDPSSSEATYRYDPPTSETVSSDPMLRDPYEAENVVVRESEIAGAGDGVYALRDMRQGQLVALYAGRMFGDTDEGDYNKLCADIKSTRSPCDRWARIVSVVATVAAIVAAAAPSSAVAFICCCYSSYHSVVAAAKALATVVGIMVAVVVAVALAAV